ncbi:hypothetical protein GCM10018952_32510 [Streptosporangium vulgare]
MPAAEDGLVGDEAVLDAHDVGEHTGVDLDGETAGDLLRLGRRGDEHRDRRLLTHEVGEQLRLGRHDVVADLRGVGQVDLLRAVLGQPGLGLGGVARARPDRRRGAQLPGQRQQLKGDLLDLALDVLDQNENLGHSS